MNAPSPRLARRSTRALIGLAVIATALASAATPSITRAASQPMCTLTIGINAHTGRCGATFIGKANVRVQVAPNGVITRTPATATIYVHPNYNNVLAVLDTRSHRWVYTSDTTVSGRRVYALLAPGALAQFKHESLRIETGARIVHGGRAACPSSLLVHHNLLRGCQDVMIVTNPWSKVLLTILYGAHTHYTVQLKAYADAKGVFQWVFPVAFNPSPREHTMAVIHVTVALGHSVKSGYTMFRVLPM